MGDAVELESQVLEPLEAGGVLLLALPTVQDRLQAAARTTSTIYQRLVRGPEALETSVVLIAPHARRLLSLSTRLSAEGLDVHRLFVWHEATPCAQRTAFVSHPTPVLLTTPESLEVLLHTLHATRRRLAPSLVVVEGLDRLVGTDRGAQLLSVLHRMSHGQPKKPARLGICGTGANLESTAAAWKIHPREEVQVVSPPRQRLRPSLVLLQRNDISAIVRDIHQLSDNTGFQLTSISNDILFHAHGNLSTHPSLMVVNAAELTLEKLPAARSFLQNSPEAVLLSADRQDEFLDLTSFPRAFCVDGPYTTADFYAQLSATEWTHTVAPNLAAFGRSSDATAAISAAIECARRGQLKDAVASGRDWCVLVQQLLSMASGPEGLTVAAFHSLLEASPYANIQPDEGEALLAYLQASEVLWWTGLAFGVGEQAQTYTARQNVLEFCRWFSGRKSYQVIAGSNRLIGQVSQPFVEVLGAPGRLFELGGSRWKISSLDHTDAILRVDVAPAGLESVWGALLPDLLDKQAAEAVADLLESSAVPSYLHASAAVGLDECRRAFARGFRGDASIWIEKKRLIWWTFAGGRINQTLRLGLRVLLPELTISANNFSLVMLGTGLQSAVIASSLSRLASPAFWKSEPLWQMLWKEAESHRIRQHFKLLPRVCSLEALAQASLDLIGTLQWIQKQLQPFGAIAAEASEGRRIEPAALRPPGEILPVGTAFPTQLPIFSTAEETVALNPPRDSGAGSPLKRPAWWAREPDFDAEPDPREPSFVPHMPIRWVSRQGELSEVCEELSRHPVISLDVETTLTDQRLCLVQLATPAQVYIVDPLELQDLRALAEILEAVKPIKLIHNASFERGVFRKLGVTIRGAVDTVQLSRKRIGARAKGGHSLAAVCRRELNIRLDKTCQTSDWTRRPLTPAQYAYAALDAEVLHYIYRCLNDGEST